MASIHLSDSDYTLAQRMWAEGIGIFFLVFVGAGTAAMTLVLGVGAPRYGNLHDIGIGAEPVKAFETEVQDFFCASVWMVGLLIQATVGGLGGVGRRPQNRPGLAA